VIFFYLQEETFFYVAGEFKKGRISYNSVQTPSYNPYNVQIGRWDVVVSELG
jgi:hypothetical protein